MYQDRAITLTLFSLVMWLMIIFLDPFQETGWLPQHVVAQDENKNILGVVPLYLKRFNVDKLSVL